MREFFDYDALTGVTTETEQPDDNLTVVHRSQDLTPLIEQAKKERTERVNDDTDWEGFGRRVAYVPVTVEAELLKYGVKLRDLNQPHTKRKFYALMKDKWPMLLTSNKRFA